MITRWLGSVARGLTAFRRRHSRLRHLVPVSSVFSLTALRSRLTEVRELYTSVEHRTRFSNVYHCCVQKTGSQWIKSMLTDIEIFKYSGLTHFHYQSRLFGDSDRRRLDERTFSEPFPEGTLVSPIYITYDAFSALPKTGSHRAFFVLRDPRDLLVSWYHSTMKNHLLDDDPTRPMFAARARLQELPRIEGLLFGIDYLADRGHFDALASWTRADQDDENVTLVRYEDLAGERGLEEFTRLLDFLDFRVPPQVAARVFEGYSFRRMTGRDPGEVDPDSHLRSGSAGGWRKDFTPEISEAFHRTTGDLVTRLGYESTVGSRGEETRG